MIWGPGGGALLELAALPCQKIQRRQGWTRVATAIHLLLGDGCLDVVGVVLGMKKLIWPLSGPEDAILKVGDLALAINIRGTPGICSQQDPRCGKVRGWAWFK